MKHIYNIHLLITLMSLFVFFNLNAQVKTKIFSEGIPARLIPVGE